MLSEIECDAHSHILQRNKFAAPLHF